MSIQLLYSNSIISKLKNIKNIFYQIIERKKRNGVFIRYYSNITHSSFKQYYQNPPVSGYSNFWNAKLLHWTNSPAFIDKRPFVIEINDHPLSVIGYFKNGAKPSFIIQNIDKVRKVFSHSSCVKIIFPCDKMMKLFQFYFNDLDLENKYEIIQGLGCYKRDQIIIPEDNLVPLKFLCICSDFKSKGVDLIIDAWIAYVDNKFSATLTIVCHNVPNSYRDILLKTASIKLIEEAPLSEKQKTFLFKTHHVSLAPTHVHCGAVVYEAIEYGHAIIYFEFHSSVHSKFGIEIKVPFTFYSPEYYGKIWHNISEYFHYLSHSKLNGEFNPLLVELGVTISELIINRKKTIGLGNKSYEVANNEYSIEYRNTRISKIYSNFV